MFHLFLILYSSFVYAQNTSNEIRLWDLQDILEKDLNKSLQDIRSSFEEYGTKPQGENSLILYGKDFWRRLTEFMEVNPDGEVSEQLFIEQFWGDQPPWLKLQGTFKRKPKDINKMLQPRFNVQSLIQGTFHLKLNTEEEETLFVEFQLNDKFHFSLHVWQESALREIMEIKWTNGRKVKRIIEKSKDLNSEIVLHQFQNPKASEIEFKRVLHRQSSHLGFIPEVRYFFNKKEISQAQYESEMSARLQNQIYFNF